jgi:hypothetical protein
MEGKEECLKVVNCNLNMINCIMLTFIRYGRQGGMPKGRQLQSKYDQLHHADIHQLQVTILWSGLYKGGRAVHV